MNAPRKPIAEIIAPARPALDALRFFTATTRGFRDREQTRLTAFLKEICPLDDYSSDEVKSWLKTKVGWVDTTDYRRGDTSGYLELLQNIPPGLLVRVRDYATLIARGSGRSPFSDELRQRIESEFSEHPSVVAPPLDDDCPRLGVRISINGVEPL